VLGVTGVIVATITRRIAMGPAGARKPVAVLVIVGRRVRGVRRRTGLASGTALGVWSCRRRRAGQSRPTRPWILGLVPRPSATGFNATKWIGYFSVARGTEIAARRWQRGGCPRVLRHGRRVSPSCGMLPAHRPSEPALTTARPAIEHETDYKNGGRAPSARHGQLPAR